MQMVAADWLKSDKREDDLAGRPGSIVQVDSYLQGQNYLIAWPHKNFEVLLAFCIKCP